MLRSLPPHDSVRPIRSNLYLPSPRDGMSSSYSSPRSSPLPPRFDSQPSSRSSPSYERESNDATPIDQSRHAGSPSVAHDTDCHERTPTPMRQSYDSPLASYTWSRYTRSGKNSSSPPLLFVQYRNYPPSSTVDSDPGSTLNGYSSFSSSETCKLSVGRGGRSPSYTKSLSAVTASVSTARERSTPYPRPIPVRQSSADSVTLVESPTHDRVSPLGDRDLQKTFRRLEINGQNNRVRRTPGGSPSWPYSSESESSSGHSPRTQGSTGATRHSTADPDTDDWTRYAKALEGTGSSAQYACAWVDPKDDILERPCGYISKKHLVKRHIESKHLQIKPITCEVCGKGFSQRTNYATHMNTHTGAAPHKCPFEGCNATFGDPARRHRHMKTVHNHQPSKRRTQSDHGQVNLDMEVSEPEEEDSP